MRRIKVLAVLSMVLLCLTSCQDTLCLTSCRDTLWSFMDRYEELVQEEPLFSLVELPLDFVAAVPFDPQHLMDSYHWDPDNAEPWFEQPYDAEYLDNVIEENKFETTSSDLKINFNRYYCLVSYGREVEGIVYTNWEGIDHYPYIVYKNKIADDLAYIYKTPQIPLVPSVLDAPIVFTRVDGKYVQFRYEKTETGFALLP